MDDACRTVLGLAAGVVAGLAAAVSALWRAYRGMVQELIQAKGEHIRVLEALKIDVQERPRKNR
jgi:hypothetical protein